MHFSTLFVLKGATLEDISGNDIEEEFYESIVMVVVKIDQNINTGVTGSK